MTQEEIIKAWKDAGYRRSIDTSDLPPHPAGLLELTDEALEDLMIAGAESCYAFSCNPPPPPAPE